MKARMIRRLDILNLNFFPLLGGFDQNVPMAYYTKPYFFHFSPPIPCTKFCFFFSKILKRKMGHSVRSTDVLCRHNYDTMEWEHEQSTKVLCQLKVQYPSIFWTLSKDARSLSFKRVESWFSLKLDNSNSGFWG